MEVRLEFLKRCIITGTRGVRFREKIKFTIDQRFPILNNPREWFENS